MDASSGEMKWSAQVDFAWADFTHLCSTITPDGQQLFLCGRIVSALDASNGAQARMCDIYICIHRRICIYVDREG
eukprot:20468-Eustigmatos_ZCMA.PRE.1